MVYNVSKKVITVSYFVLLYYSFLAPDAIMP